MVVQVLKKIKDEQVSEMSHFFFHKDKIEDGEITCGGIIDWILQKNECAICRANTYCQPCVDYY